MAFLVCYVSDGVVDWSDKAAYLDQKFYELLYKARRKLAPDGVLAEIAELKYGEEIVLSQPRLHEAREELARFSRYRFFRLRYSSYSQFKALGDSIRAAIEEGAELSIAGDMHPEIG